MKSFILFLFNGGLSPAQAAPDQIRRRRIVASMFFLLLCIGTVLLSVNLLFFNSPVENIHIALLIILGVLAICLQAYKGWEKFAAMVLVGIFILAPTSITILVGLTGVGWVWIFPSVVIANLVLGRKMAVGFAIIGILCMLSFAVLSQLGHLPTNIVATYHPSSVAVTGSLLLIIICATGFTFRTIQIKDEARITSQILRLNEEVQIRRQAELAALAGKRAKAIFLENISHELRTPLNGVIGASQLLTDKALSQQEQELLNVVTDSGEILLDLINNVLDMSEMEEENLALESGPMELRSTIKSALTPLIILANKKGVSVNFHAHESVPDYIEGDATRLRQIILNLGGNALKFTEVGKIDVTLSKIEDKLRIIVSDTGIGISKTDQEKLFQPFVQANSSTSRQFGGSGLGLSIVAQLVELIGGQISVQSELGSGSTFTLLLPLRELDTDKTVNAHENITRPTQTPHSRKILLTDDNMVNRLVASKMLEKLGCQVIEAEDGEQAIAALRSQAIDLVFMDVQMPVMDGITATKCIRAMPNPFNSLPIIGLSAHTMEHNQSAMLAAGMNCCLSKPIKIDQLQSVLTEYTALAQSQ